MLCTPTGSGKTAIAELAIIQSLYSKDIDEDELNNSVALYIVPKRALAAEVESKLSKVLKKVKIRTNIEVTALYGGNDYGISDASIEEVKEPLVVICTQEKTDALIRILGNEFLQRIKLVVIDEAHNIDFQGNLKDLKDDKSRELKLESLITRLKIALNYDTRFIGLSAVAEGIEKILSQFISSKDEAIKSKLKSTRQTFGKLRYYFNKKNDSKNRGYQAQYSMIDNKYLKLDKSYNKYECPIVENPISKFPYSLNTSDYNEEDALKLKKALYWAALNFASQKTNNRNKTVLISVISRKEQFNPYSNNFIKFIENLEKDPDVDIPVYFAMPNAKSIVLYKEAQAICEDYFGKESVEYKLLQKGIILHHGKMPGRLGRKFVELIEKNVVNVVLSTSTLVEGVNLPFEIILVPHRSLDANIKDFKNLMGRAGRPTLTPEGQIYVVMPADNSKKHIHTKQSHPSEYCHPGKCNGTIIGIFI